MSTFENYLGLEEHLPFKNINNCNKISELRNPVYCATGTTYYVFAMMATGGIRALEGLAESHGIKGCMMDAQSHEGNFSIITVYTYQEH
jgi:hypothetical protein